MKSECNGVIEDKIKSCTYTELPSGKSVVCEIMLNNDFIVVGVGLFMSPSYDFKLDPVDVKKIAYNAAFEQIYKLEAFLMKEDIHRGQ